MTETTITLTDPPALTLDLEANKIDLLDEEYPEKWNGFMVKMELFSGNLSAWNTYLTDFKNAVEMVGEQSVKDAEAAATAAADNVREELTVLVESINENTTLIRSALAAANMPIFTEADYGKVLVLTENGYELQTPLWRPVEL